jgi:hypothetical protein
MLAVRFKFDEFEVDPANFQLRRSGSPVQIERIQEIRAAIELKRDNAMRAVELLAPVAPYEGAGLTTVWPLTSEVKHTLQSTTVKKRRWSSRK